MNKIYEDIATRTGGNIYIGVVGPVRSGKSTLIKRFMETAVLPQITDENEKSRAMDELPQSAGGKTVMTAEPKFIPENPVRVTSEDGSFFVKMIDCVGYIAPGALGTTENGSPRLVNTPWQEEPMPFEKAAEIGTQKVICEHSTVGLAVTADGSFGELPRESYVEPEKRIVNELKAIGKPFALILNTLDATSASAKELSESLQEEYGVPVIPKSCLTMTKEDIDEVLKTVLLRFPVKEVSFSLPDWYSGLENDHWLKEKVRGGILECGENAAYMSDLHEAFSKLDESQYVSAITVAKSDFGCGKASLTVELANGLFFDVLSEKTGCEIKSNADLMEKLQNFSQIKRKYEKVSEALEKVKTDGYGIVTPDMEDLHLEEPEIVKQSGGYGVKLRASAPSIHMMLANIETEVSPIVGTEKQSEELVKYLLSEFDEDPKKIWESELFGKNLHELVNEGLHAKLNRMPDVSRRKLTKTLERIINEESGGLICIIL